MRQTSAEQPHFLSRSSIFTSSAPSSGVFSTCFKYFFLLQTTIIWNASRKVISFIKWLRWLEMPEFCSEWWQPARSAGTVLAPRRGLSKPCNHCLQGAPGFTLNTKAQGYHLNTEIFPLPFLHTHMSTFIICISRTGIWGAGESETEELNPSGDFRASAGKSPQAWSNQMQLRPI